MPPPLLSACLITRDEAGNVERAVASLHPLADEVVVYDTGSSDDTVARARAAGARVLTGIWPRDFAAARNAALAHCTGDWVLSLDADEELRCPDPPALRALLRQAPPGLHALQLSIDNLLGVGHESGYAHVADRLFRRRACAWRGRVHEQLVDVASGELVRSRYVRAARILHHGYGAAQLADRRKSDRNLALAHAEVEQPSFGDRGIALVNLGRALWGAGRAEEALRPLSEGAATAKNPTARRQGLTAAARILTRLGRLDEATTVIDRLRTESASAVTADALEAGVALARRNFGRALALLPAANETVRDDDGYEHSPASTAEWRAAALYGLGRADEAANLLLALAAEQAGLVAHLDLYLTILEATGRSLTDLTDVIGTTRRPALVAEALLLRPERAERVLEHLWSASADPGSDDELCAAAALIGQLLPPDAALVWARRLRECGKAALCPLAAQAGDLSLPPLRRVTAALRVLEAFGDESVARHLDHALAALGDECAAALSDAEPSARIAQALPVARALAAPHARRTSTPANPLVSVIIHASGGAETVLTSLGTLAGTLPEQLVFEIVLVDTGTTDATAIVLENIRGDVTIVRTEAVLGDAAAWNDGVAAARGTALAFIDTTVTPRPGWLEPLVRRVTERRRLGAAGPALVDRAGRLLAAGASAQLAAQPLARRGGLPVHPWAAADGTRAVRVTWLGGPRANDGEEPDELRGGPLLPSSALVVRRDAFEEIAGFDTQYWNGGDGFDLSVRLHRRGWNTTCDRRATVELADPEVLSAPFGTTRDANGLDRARGVSVASHDNEHRFLERAGPFLPDTPH